jgi:hypothetical protein
VFDAWAIVSHCGAGCLPGDDDVDIITATQAVIRDRQQRVGIRRKIDADDIGFLVHDVIDEAGVLMTEPVVILPPDVEDSR